MMGSIFSALENINENTLEALKNIKHSIYFFGNSIKD